MKCPITHSFDRKASSFGKAFEVTFMNNYRILLAGTSVVYVNKLMKRLSGSRNRTELKL